MKILLHAKFEKKFDTLPLSLQSRFFERVAIFRDNQRHPILHDHSVDKAYPGWRSINVTGDYRALYEEQNGDIVFMKIGTHPELYG